MTNIERFPRRLRFVLERIPRPKRLQAKRIAWHIAPKKRQLSKVEIGETGIGTIGRRQCIGHSGEGQGEDFRRAALQFAIWVEL